MKKKPARCPVAVPGGPRGGTVKCSALMPCERHAQAAQENELFRREQARLLKARGR